jgi:hypothetical protein
MLELLIAARPRALSKAELQERLWPDTFVSETNLASLAAEIRRALARRDASALRTVHGFGYAFSADAREEPGAPPESRYRLVAASGEIPLSAGENIVGREPGARVRLDLPRVSRRHARILVEGPLVTIEDLGSKNGTYVGARRLAAPRRLDDGDEILIGSALLTFRVFSADGSTETGLEPPAMPAVRKVRPA